MNRFDVLDATGAGDANLGRPSRQEDVDLTSKTHKCMLRIKSAESKLRKLHGEQEEVKKRGRNLGRLEMQLEIDYPGIYKKADGSSSGPSSSEPVPSDVVGQLQASAAGGPWVGTPPPPPNWRRTYEDIHGVYESLEERVSRLKSRLPYWEAHAVSTELQVVATMEVKTKMEDYYRRCGRIEVMRASKKDGLEEEEATLLAEYPESPRMPPVAFPNPGH